MIPARNEERATGALLDSLLRQTYPAFEIIVVDAGSVDCTAQIVREYREKTVRLVSIEPAFPGTARNAGVRKATSDYIAFTDAGIQLDTRWLEKLCAAQDQLPVPDVIFGTYEPVTSSFFARCAATAYVPAKSGDRAVGIRGPSIASCLLRKSVFEAIGGFEAYRAAEDLIFLEKIQQQGFTVAHAPDAVAHWELASCWTSTYRRFTLYSYHNLVAGRGRHWHHGVARFYTLAAPFLILGLVNQSAWLGIPILGVCARVALTVWRKRNENWGATLNPLIWIGVGLILLLLDAATFSGAVWWAWDGFRRSYRPRRRNDVSAGREETPA